MQLSTARALTESADMTHLGEMKTDSERGRIGFGSAAAPSLPVRREDLILREGTALPEGIALLTKPLLPGWQLVQEPQPFELERAVRPKGWHLFFLAGNVEATGIARNQDAALNRALKKLVAGASADRLNAIQIARVKMSVFLGLWKVRVTATLRHLQKGPVLHTVGD